MSFRKFITLLCLLISVAFLVPSSALAETYQPPTNEKIAFEIERGPRDFGITIGDVIHQKISFSLPDTLSIDEKMLPTLGAIKPWLELIDFSYAQPQPHHYEVTLTYQLFLQVTKPEQITIPASTLLLDNGQTFLLPTWEINYSPMMTKPLTLPSIQSPVALSAPSLAAPKQKLYLLGLLAALLVLGLLALSGKIPFLRDKAGPFTRSLRLIKTLKKPSTSIPKFIRKHGIALSESSAADDATGVRSETESETTQKNRIALALFHQALAESASHQIFIDQLNSFFRENPLYAPLEEQTKALLCQSHLVRFDDQPAASLPAIGDTLALCQSFSQKEQSAWK